MSAVQVPAGPAKRGSCLPAQCSAVSLCLRLSAQLERRLLGQPCARPHPVIHAPASRRPGCTYLTVDLHLDQQRAAALLGDASASGPDDAGASTSAQLPHCSSSKQLDDGAGADGCEGAGSTAAPCAASGDARAALLQRLACQLLQRRSMGDVGSAGPMLLQLNAHHLAVVAGGRLLRCMPLPTQAPAPAAAAALAAPAPAIPHLLAVSPSVLVLPPPPPPGSSASCEPAVLALTGHGLWDKAGAPGLVLCRQHGAPTAAAKLRLL